jgi:hypothetical protein
MILSATKKGITLWYPKTREFTVDGRMIICGETIDDPDLMLKLATEEDLERFPTAVFAVLKEEPCKG